MPRPIKEYSLETQETAVSLYLAGLSLRKAGESAKAPPHKVAQWLEERGHDRRDKFQTEDDLDFLKEKSKVLYGENKSLDEIAAIVDRSKATVKQWLIQNGVMLRKSSDRTLAIIVPLSPELEKIPEGERRKFCLEAIDNALKK